MKKTYKTFFTSMPNRELKQPGYTYEGTVVMSAVSEMSVQVLAIAHRAVD